jgi:hypothetical protein
VNRQNEEMTVANVKTLSKAGDKKKNEKIHRLHVSYILHGVGVWGGSCMRMYPKVSVLAAWSENCKWYSSQPLGAVVSLFCESVY